MDDSTTRPRLSVIGLGKLGSPMAAVFGAKGFEVIGFDVNPTFVAAINEGRAPVQEPQLQECLNQARGRVRATLDPNEAIIGSDISFVIVPTPSGPDRTFVNRFVVEAVEHIGAALNAKTGYHVVVITSTVMPGSTDGELRAALERTSGRIVGQDVGLCYNPEFIALGSVVHDMLFPDMILIGESDKRAGDMLEAIYHSSVESKPEFQRMNSVNAELCKISVNTFVTTKISYANMIAEVCDNLPDADAEVVTRAVGADSRIGRKYLKPAIGYGGPCFPRDNKAFTALGRKLGVNTDLAEATDRINDHQLQRLIGAVSACADSGEAIAVLGLSYKPDTAVVEESQGIALTLALAELGYCVRAFDPLARATAEALLNDYAEVAQSAEAALAGAAVAVVTTAWSQFRNLDFIGCGVGAVIDPWGIVPAEAAAGLRLVRLGHGGWRRKVKPRHAAA